VKKATKWALPAFALFRRSAIRTLQFNKSARIMQQFSIKWCYKITGIERLLKDLFVERKIYDF